MAVENKMYLSRLTTDITDLTTNKSVKESLVSLSVDQLQDGLIAEIGARNFSVLLAVASFANEDNQAFPTVDKLAEVVGLSKPTVITAIRELENVRIGGKRIFSKSKVMTSTGNAKSIYNIINEASKASAVNTPVDYIEHFCKIFEEVFERSYVPSYGRDMKILKDKIIPNFPPEDIPEIIEIAVRSYPQWNKNPDYPTPTIIALSWLSNRANDLLQKQRKEEQTMLDRIEVAEKAEQYNPLNQLDLL